LSKSGARTGSTASRSVRLYPAVGFSYVRRIPILTLGESLCSLEENPWRLNHMVALNKTAGPAPLFARSSSARSALAFSCRVRAAQYDPGAPASLGGCRRSEVASQSLSARFGSILPFFGLDPTAARAFWTAERGMSRQVNLCFAVLGVRPKRQHVDLLTTKSDNLTTSKNTP
jgi:hypothetical protein